MFWKGTLWDSRFLGGVAYAVSCSGPQLQSTKPSVGIGVSRCHQNQHHGAVNEYIRKAEAWRSPLLDLWPITVPHYTKDQFELEGAVSTMGRKAAHEAALSVRSARNMPCISQLCKYIYSECAKRHVSGAETKGWQLLSQNGCGALRRRKRNAVAQLVSQYPVRLLCRPTRGAVRLQEEPVYSALPSSFNGRCQNLCNRKRRQP